MKIIIDTREQKPFLFSKYPVETEIKKLETGDYSLEDQENSFCIERKSLPDLFQTLSKGRKRFKREFDRMRLMRGACLIIECDSFYNIFEYSKNNKFTKMNPKSIWHTILIWSVGYRIPVFFVGFNRDIAEKNVYNLLKLWNDKINIKKAGG